MIVSSHNHVLVQFCSTFSEGSNVSGRLFLEYGLIGVIVAFLGKRHPLIILSILTGSLVAWIRICLVVWL